VKYALAIVQLGFGLGLFLCATIPVYPHGGGLDGYGCHNNRKAAALISPSTLRNQPDDNPYYRNDQNRSDPNSGLENISDHLTTAQSYRRKSYD
jgi:hypothetical protein